MNIPINTSQAGFSAGSTTVGGVTGSDALNPDATARSSLADQDWFSAQALSQGQAIETARFDSTANRMSVEEAAEKVFSRLFSAPANTPWS